MSEYSKKFKDPRWQKRRLDILELNGFECVNCGDDKSTLHVHHKFYRKGADPWDYSDNNLIVLCETCHSELHDAMLEVDRAIGSVLNKESLLRIVGYAMAIEGELPVNSNCNRYTILGLSDYYRTRPDVINYCAKKHGSLPAEIHRQVLI